MASGNVKETNETVEYTSGHLEHTGNVQTSASVETSDEREKNKTGNNIIYIFIYFIVNSKIYVKSKEC